MTADGGGGPRLAGATLRPALIALALVLSISFALLAHAAVAEGLPPALGALLSLVPIAVVLAVMLRRGRRPLLLLAGLAVLAAAALWLGWSALERHFRDLFFLEHCAVTLTLGIVFGRTLLGGREPLVTRFARIVHDGRLPPGVAGYTRRLTLAWTVFFGASLAISAALYSSGRPAAWSFYANIVSPLLVAAMFVGEYALRLRVLPHVERVGVLGGVRAFMRHVRAASPEAPR